MVQKYYTIHFITFHSYCSKIQCERTCYLKEKADSKKVQATNGSIIKSTNRRSRLLSMAFYLEAMLGVMWAAIHFTMEWLDRATMEISVEVSPTPPLSMHNHFHYFLVQLHTVSFKLQKHICVGSISKFTTECYRYHVSFFLNQSWSYLDAQ